MIAGQNFYMSVKGDAQYVYNGAKHEYIQGDHTVQYGKQSKQHTDAAKNLQKATTEIDKAKMETIKTTEGADVPCPTCKQKFLTDRAQAITDKAFKYIKNWFASTPFPIDKVQKFINTLVAPFLSTTSNLALNGGQGCGSPGCKGGVIKSPITSIQTGNEKAATMLNEKKDELAKHQTNLESGGSRVSSDTGDVVWRVGTAKNDSPTVVLKDHGTTPHSLVNSASPGLGLRLDTKGNCQQAIHSDPLINPGSLFVDVSNKLTIATGSPGIDIHTSGKTQLNSSTTTILANEGELTLSSNNKTVLKGKNILIDAKDRSGTTGLRIESDNTMVAGKLSVTGDIALKGSIMMDGSLHCTHLHGVSETLDTRSSGSSNQVHSNANWNNPIAPQATILDNYDNAYKKVSHELYNTLTQGWLLLPEMVRKIKNTYSSALLKVPLDNAGLPTGFGWALKYETLTPLDVIVFLPTGGTLPGIVVPNKIPIHNYPHNHGNPGDNHSHEHTTIAFDGYDNPTAARATRPDPSHVPTPSKAKGMGQRPGPKSLGDISSCGGGGSAFINSRVENARRKRNQKYNLGDDIYNNENYVNTTPEKGNYKFNGDGSMTPPPTLNILDC
jgi:hypothetical protein